MAEFVRENLKEGETGITVIRVRGPIHKGEMIEFVQGCDYDSREYRTLWDLRQASWSTIPFTDMIKGLGQLFKYTRDGQRTAFVYGRDVDFGIARMLEPHFERFGIKSKIWPFKDYQKAINWLLDNSKDDNDDPLEFFEKVD